MIAADTSTRVAFLEGDAGEDVRLLDRALADRQVVMVPVVLTELLSDPKIPSSVAETLSEVPSTDISSGYWQRAEGLRAKVLAKRRKQDLGYKASWVLRRKHYSTLCLKGFKTATSKCAKSRSFRVDTVRP